MFKTVIFFWKGYVDNVILGKINTWYWHKRFLKECIGITFTEIKSLILLGRSIDELED